MARNRMNKLLGVTQRQFHWFSGLWTFLFTPFYFNYKINQLAEDLQVYGSGEYEEYAETESE